MSFTTFEFFLFIAAAVIIYYVIPKKLQWIWLLIISYVYYASYDISTVWMLLLTTYVTYRGGILLDRLNEQKPQDGISREEKKDFKKNIVRKKKKIVLAMVLIAFGMLGIMKYTNFMLGNIDAVLRLFGSGKQIGVLNLTLLLMYTEASIRLRAISLSTHYLFHFFRSFYKDRLEDMKDLEASCMKDTATI